MTLAAFDFTIAEQAAAPVWPWIAHSAEQIQQAGSDGKAWVTAQRKQLRALLGQVAVAETAEDVAAIGWLDADV